LKEAAPTVQLARVFANDSQYETKAVLVTENKTSTRVVTNIAQSVRQ
jgi:hypothetical protein